MAFTYVTVTHNYSEPDEAPATGTVEFTPVWSMRNEVTVVSAPVKVPLTSGGLLSQRLAANTDPSTIPTGTTYRVVEKLDGQPDLTYFVQIPHDGISPVDLRELAGWQPAEAPESVVATINGEGPDGSGNVVVSAADVGAQPAAALLTRFAATPVLIAYSAVITLDASAGSTQRLTATSDVTVIDIINGIDTQELVLEVTASGGGVNLTVAGETELISAGDTRVASFRYDAADDTWMLTDTGTGSGGGYTDEQVRDVVGATLVQGSNVTITPSDVGDTITISAATSGSVGIPASTVDAKGDLLVATGADAVARFPVGSNGQHLRANSGTSTGLEWGADPLARANHTGTQSTSTITGLASVATSGSASDLGSGTVGTARLGSGSASSSTFLRGDQTWATPSGGSSTTVTHNVQVGSYTAVLADAGKVVEHTSGSANNHTVPPNSSVAFPVGTYYSVRQYGAGQTTLVAGSGVTLRSRGGALKLAGQYAEATLTKRATDEWVISGEVTP